MLVLMLSRGARRCGGCGRGGRDRGRGEDGGVAEERLPSRGAGGWGRDLEI